MVVLGSSTLRCLGQRYRILLFSVLECHVYFAFILIQRLICLKNIPLSLTITIEVCIYMLV